MPDQAKKVYALMIAINNYPIPKHRLNGCVNDMRALQAYLRNKFGEQFDVLELTDEKATKQGVIKGFDHFKKAQDGDICLLYYSGHGSQAAAPREFWHLDPDQENESIVCYDSRQPGGIDLMDKELSFLIHRATLDKDVHFLAIFDCCHAGNNTREINFTSRQMPPSHTPARLEDYFGYEEYLKTEGERLVADGPAIAELTPPRGRHVQLAAAKSSETAKELRINGQVRGIFTYNLVQMLEQSGDDLTYNELINSLKTRIANKVSDQTPQLDAMQVDDKNLGIFNGAGKQSESLYVVNYNEKFGEWTINAGHLNGLPVDQPEKVKIQLIKPAGEYTLGKVMATQSTVKGIKESDTQTVFKAYIKETPTPKVKVALIKGDDKKGQKLLREVNIGNFSDHFELTDDVGEADFFARAIDDTFRLTMPGDERPVFRRVPGFTEDQAELFLRDVEAVAKWNRTLDIRNPKTTISDKDFEIKLYRLKEAGAWEDDDMAPAELLDWRTPNVFRYDYDASKPEKKRWRQPAFRLKIKNTSNRPFYFGALYMQANFKISDAFFPVQELKPGQEAEFQDRPNPRDLYRSIPLEVYPGFLSWGVTEITEHVKVFISTIEFDTSSFKQDALKLDDPKLDPSKRAGRASEEEKEPHSEDWTTIDIPLTIIRPLDKADLQPAKPVTIADAISIEIPEGVSGTASVSGADDAARLMQSTRSLDDEPFVLPNENKVWDLYKMKEGLANTSALSVLELHQVEGAANVTADNPIRLNLKEGLAENEIVVPVGYDPESGLYFPLGHPSFDGELLLETLPDPSPAGTRSLGGSIKIFFQKTVLPKLGFEYKHPQLAMAVFGEDGNFTYDLDQEKLKAKIAASNEIAVFLHGIIGDTLDCTKVVKMTGPGDVHPLDTRFDVILTFDYENLNTDIEQTAKDLKKRLEEVGLTPGHGKQLTLIAHSMGGLVSRWFIEKEGGNEVVSHLVQLGTPNSGSPWSSVYELTSSLLTKAVNGAAFLQPYLFILSVLGKGVDKLFRTLEQMHEDSDFLKKLNDGTDPGIPYTIIAGNTQLVSVEYDQKQKSLLKKLFQRFKKRGHYDALDIFLFKEPNDIAVAVTSILGIPGKENRQFKPIEMQTAADHISYFCTPDSFEKLVEAVRKGEPVAG